MVMCTLVIGIIILIDVILCKSINFEVVMGTRNIWFKFI